MNQEEPKSPVLEQNAASRRVLRFLRIVSIVIGLVLLLKLYHWLDMPAYQGRDLKQWLHLSLQSPGFSDKSKECEAVIRQMGSKTLPYLLEWVAEEESPLKYRVIEWCLNSQSDWLPKPVHASVDHARGLAGFRALGADAKPAVPELIRLLESRASSKDRVIIIWALEAIGPAAQEAVPSLVRLAKQGEFRELKPIANALGKIHSFPEIAVPLLASLLQHEDVFIRSNAAMSLAEFGPQAKSAVPQLLKAILDPDENVARPAGFALKRIDPEAATKAGIP